MISLCFGVGSGVGWLWESVRAEDLFPSFGTLQGNAIDRSDSNPMSAAIRFQPAPLATLRGNPGAQ